MIALLTGKVIAQEATSFILAVNGVGYEIDAPITTLLNLPDNQDDITIHTHFVVREDAQQLYGFIDSKERNLFRLLLKVNGIGARTALAMLSTMDANTLVNSIVSNDTTMLSKVPGIGKKTAERISIDLRDKLHHWAMDGALDAKASALQSAPVTLTVNQVEADATAALVSLGYKPADANRLIKKIIQPDMSSEELIRLSLQAAVNA